MSNAYAQEKGNTLQRSSCELTGALPLTRRLYLRLSYVYSNIPLAVPNHIPHETLLVCLQFTHKTCRREFTSTNQVKDSRKIM